MKKGFSIIMAFVTVMTMLFSGATFADDTNENTENIIEVENLCCLSGSQYLLNNINWKVKAGELYDHYGEICGAINDIGLLNNAKKKHEPSYHWTATQNWFIPLS